MISDPKTTPDSRAGRILVALLVAAGGDCIQFGLYRTHGLHWPLAVIPLSTPLLDQLFSGTKYQWNSLINLLVKGAARKQARFIPAPTVKSSG